MHPETFEAWTKNPIVKRILDKDPDLNPLRILERLSETLNELEEKFPNLPFEEIFVLQRVHPDSEALRASMRRCGVPQEAIDLISPVSRKRLGNYDRFKALADTGLSAQDLMRKGHPKNTSFFAQRMRRPLTKIETEIGEYVLDNPDVPVTDIEDKFNVSDNTAMQYAMKVKYHRERAA